MTDFQAHLVIQTLVHALSDTGYTPVTNARLPVRVQLYSQLKRWLSSKRMAESNSQTQSLSYLETPVPSEWSVGVRNAATTRSNCKKMTLQSISVVWRCTGGEETKA